jgi:hypothetical protein
MLSKSNYISFELTLFFTTNGLDWEPSQPDLYGVFSNNYINCDYEVFPLLEVDSVYLVTLTGCILIFLRGELN